MAQTDKNFRLTFISGQLSGRSFALSCQRTILGSGATATWQLTAPGINSQHLSLQSGPEGVTLQVLGNSQVRINHMELSPDSEVLLPADTEVELPEQQIFRVEEYTPVAAPEAWGLPRADAISVPNLELVDTETATETTATVPDPPISPQPPENSATDQAQTSASAAPRTRYASPEELQDLRQYLKTQKQRRIIKLAIFIVVLLLIIVLPYIYSLLKIENPLTWPGAINDKYNDGEFRTQIGSAGKFLIYYPKSPHLIEKKSGANFEVLTALGKNLDVPFHLQLTCAEIPHGYRATRAQSFAKWLRYAAENFKLALVDNLEQDFYAPTGAGVPYYKFTYTRHWGKLRWQGMASYMRYQNREIVLLREVPIDQFHRAAQVLQDYSCLVVSKSFRRTYWEIPENIATGSATRLLQQINWELRKNPEVADWDALDLWLRSLLSRAYEKSDQLLMNTVQPLWAEFRHQQQLWYSQNCLAYQSFALVQDKAGMKRIFEQCLNRFKSPNDYRHIRIIKNIWVIE